MDHFVGRVSELSVLDAEMRAVLGGRPRVVLVEGEAGIGKSSLLSRFVSEHGDVCVLRASGDEAAMFLDWDSPTSSWPVPGWRPRKDSRKLG